MRVLLLGSGGREHALARALLASPQLAKLFVAPGNPGIAKIATCLSLSLSDHTAILSFCQKERVDFVVIGPEAPLVAGLVDVLQAAGILAFGPTKAAAQLEGSKGYTKDLCRACGIPTADYARFSHLDDARAYVHQKNGRLVVKADGLAAGKGVVVAQNRAEADAALTRIFEGTFGQTDVVLEDILEGREASFFALCDGEYALALGSAQDHKRAYDGDQGPNTGGMGAFSPHPLVDLACEHAIMDRIIFPTLREMKARGTPFRGILFAGLMIGEKGPHLIEYNVRFGDPETQVLLPRLEEDLLDLLLSSARGSLKGRSLRLSQDTTLAIVYAAQGYPDAPLQGTQIKGLEHLEGDANVHLLHAGTREEEGRILAQGGRVLNIVAQGRDIPQARQRAYAAIEKIEWLEGFYRSDIGQNVPQE